MAVTCLNNDMSCWGGGGEDCIFMYSGSVQLISFEVWLILKEIS